MKDEAIFRAVGAVGEDLIARAEQPPKRQTARWKPFVTLAACCVLIVGAAALILPRMAVCGSTGNDTAAPQAAMVTEDAAEARAYAEESMLVESAAPAESAGSAAADYDTAAPEATTEARGEEAASARTADAAPEGDWILFGGQYYTLAPANDGAHLASEGGDGEARGEVLGTVEDSSDADNTGCTVYAYPAEGYVLVERGDSYQLYKLADLD